jgi:hypothetical protein
MDGRAIIQTCPTAEYPALRRDPAVARRNPLGAVVLLLLTAEISATRSVAGVYVIRISTVIARGAAHRWADPLRPSTIIFPSVPSDVSGDNAVTVGNCPIAIVVMPTAQGRRGKELGLTGKNVAVCVTAIVAL